MANEIPPGFRRNSPEQMAHLSTATLAAWSAVEGVPVVALGLVFAMEDGTVVASLAFGGIKDRSALTALLTHGPETLRVTIARFIDGHGETQIIPGGAKA